MQAVQVLRLGGTIVFPTDTVYGIGCDPYNLTAVNKIYELKARETSKALPVLVFSFEEVKKIAKVNSKVAKIAEKFWPGALTMILELTDDRLRKSLKLHDSIAIRIPNNKCILSILQEWRLIVGSSANVSGMRSFQDPNECLKNFFGYDLFVNGGKIYGNGESTVIDIKDGNLNVLRLGAISKEQIQEIF